MTYRIEQDFEYVGHDYWRWRAWIEATDDELEQISKVVWLLHPTFKKSRVTVDDPLTKFRLETAGWGTFLLRAEVRLKDGEKRLLKRNLRLEYPDTAADSAASRSSKTRRAARPLTVFLSYSAEDARAAAMLRQSLTTAGLEVLDQTRLRPGESWRETLSGMISLADAVIGIVGESDISPWVREEMAAAAYTEKPTLAVLMPGASGAGLSGSVQALQMDESNIGSKTIDKVLSFVKTG